MNKTLRPRNGGQGCGFAAIGRAGRIRLASIALPALLVLIVSSCGAGEQAEDPPPTIPDATAEPDVTPEPDARPLRGVTDDTIFVGVPWSDTGRAVQTFDDAGSPVGDLGEIQFQAQLIIDYINEQGGVAGRQLEPVFFERSLEAENDPEAAQRQYQAMCAAFTEDAEVFAIMNGMRGHPVLTQCAARTGTYEIAGIGSLMIDSERFAELDGYLFQVNNLTSDRRDRAYVEGLVELGFFTPEARVGLLIYDDPSARSSADRVLKPALDEYEISLTTEALYTRDGFFGSGNSWPTIAFQFQESDITHVLFSSTDQLFGAPHWFMQAAETQGYRPQYGMASDLVPAFLANQSPVEQLPGVVGIGWRPDNDGVPGVLEDEPNNELCRRVMREGGEPETAAAGVQFCETFFFFKEAMDTPGASLDRFPEAVYSLGASYSPVLTFGTYFEPGRHDGVSLVRDVAYDEPCGCFAYTSEPREVP